MKFEKFIYLDIYQVLYRTNTNFCTLERNLFFLFNFLYYININIFTNIFQPIILDLNLSLPIWIYLDIQPPSLSLLLFFFLFLSFTPSCPLVKDHALSQYRNPINRLDSLKVSLAISDLLIWLDRNLSLN